MKTLEAIQKLLLKVILSHQRNPATQLKRRTSTSEGRKKRAYLPWQKNPKDDDPIAQRTRGQPKKATITEAQPLAPASPTKRKRGNTSPAAPTTTTAIEQRPKLKPRGRRTTQLSYPASNPLSVDCDSEMSSPESDDADDDNDDDADDESPLPNKTRKLTATHSTSSSSSSSGTNGNRIKNLDISNDLMELDAPPADSPEPHKMRAHRKEYLWATVIKQEYRSTETAENDDDEDGDDDALSRKQSVSSSESLSLGSLHEAASSQAPDPKAPKPPRKIQRTYITNEAASCNLSAIPKSQKQQGEKRLPSTDDHGLHKVPTNPTPARKNRRPVPRELRCSMVSEQTGALNIRSSYLIKVLTPVHKPVSRRQATDLVGISGGSKASQSSTQARETPLSGDGGEQMGVNRNMEEEQEKKK